MIDYVRTDASLDLCLREAVNAARLKARVKLEGRLERAMMRAFREQGRIFVGSFSRLKGRFQEAVQSADWSPLFDHAALMTLRLFTEPIDTLVRQAIQAGAITVIGELGAQYSFELKHPRAVAYLQNHGATRVTQINETTRGYLRTLITKAVDEGWSYDRTAKAIMDRYREFAAPQPQKHIRSRAHLVAVTEVGNGYEAGGNIVAKDLQRAGLEIQKSWLTIGDDRVDPHCYSNEVVGWIPLDEAFPSGSMYPLDHPACRCTALYRVAPD